MNHKNNRLYFFITSISGLFILLFLVLYTHHGIEQYQQLIILYIFVLICILGMLAAVSPSTCNSLTMRTADDDDSPKKLYLGHHPECGEFENHTYTLFNKKICSGCSGLFTGAVFAVVATVTCILYGVPVSSNMTEFYTGFTMVLLSFIGLYFWRESTSAAKFLLNLLLVVGSFLILIALAGVKANLSVQIYYLLLICIWIITRISMSEFVHGSVCEDCGMESTCIYK